MDAPLHPPVRLNSLRSQPISSEVAQQNISKFLEEYAGRARMDGNQTVIAHLTKLQESLAMDNSKDSKTQ
ncbi:hypothetical protein FRC02_006428 [Tulasnella sp. 418]|nr:hypothetical protein FRC02_006428 [Tulasnella sp. 418]